MTTTMKAEPISPTDPHEFVPNGHALGMCRECGCHVDAHCINGLTFDEFADRVERLTDLGGLGRKIERRDVMYPWFASQGVGETANQILGNR